jgi:hypothetical protein
METGYDVVKSEILAETIIVGDFITKGDIPRKYASCVIYTNREASTLTGLDDETVRTLHRLKKVFHGHILPRAKPARPSDSSKRKLPVLSVRERFLTRHKRSNATKDVADLQEPPDDNGELPGDATEDPERQARLDRRRRALATIAALPVAVGGGTATTTPRHGTAGMGSVPEQELF